MVDLGVTTTTDKLALLVRRVAAMLFGGQSGDEERDTGIREFRDALLEVLDTGDITDPPHQDIQADARKYCQDRCPYSEDEPPGTHLVCKQCTLKKHTIDPFEGAAEDLVREAVEEKKRS